MKVPTCLIALSAVAVAQSDLRVSTDSQGNPGNAWSDTPRVSADGAHVAFASWASNLIPGGTTPNVHNVYVYAMATGRTQLVSIGVGGAQADANSCYAQGDTGPAISADGRYVAFSSLADNLVPNSPTNTSGVFVRDMQAGVTVCLSDGNISVSPAISGDGRFVAFVDSGEVLVRDRQLGTTEALGLSSSPFPIYAPSCSISSDGRYVAFGSSETDLVPGDTNGVDDVFLRDRLLGTTECVSFHGNAASYYGVTSDDGRFVFFYSFATNLIPTSPGRVRCFRRDRLTGALEVASIADVGSQYVLDPPPAISADGRFVALHAPFGVYERDCATGEATQLKFPATIAPSLSSTGRYMAFASNGQAYLHDRGY